MKGWVAVIYCVCLGVVAMLVIRPERGEWTPRAGRPIAAWWEMASEEAESNRALGVLGCRSSAVEFVYQRELEFLGEILQIWRVSM